MAQITAALVKQLRDKTGAGMGDCKKALQETEGDVEKAVDVLRAKGVKQSQAERSAAEGAVAFELSDDAKAVAIVDLRCETDFAARSENFTKLVDLVCGAVLEHGAQDAEAAKKIPAIADGLQEAAAMTIRENIVLAHAEKKALEGDGAIGTYVHHNGSLGAAIAVNAPAGAEGKPAFKELLRELAMHVTAHDPTPVGIDKDSIPEDLVDRERAVHLAAIDESEKDRNKPDEIKQKMIDGKMRRFFQERALLEQKSVKDPDATVRQLLEKTGEDLGGPVSVAWFVRRAVGG